MQAIPMRLKLTYTSFFVKLNFVSFQTRRFHYFSEDGYDVEGPRPFEVTAFFIVILEPLPCSLFSVPSAYRFFSQSRVAIFPRAHVVHSLYYP